ncbi:MAG: tRNA (adenosine(37)-N6)-threonylcarbamoyltransferase complex ATPase subunit type 1 TsaE [bacterium]
MTVVTRSSGQTMAFGRRLGAVLRGGDVVALTGPLGSGKTTLTKGIAAGAGVAEPRWVTSPTFVLIHEYPGRVPVYHVDGYRLGGAADAEALGVEELFYGEGVTIVEWADRMGEILPAQRLDILLAHAGGDERTLTLSPRGARYARLVDRLEQ